MGRKRHWVKVKTSRSIVAENRQVKVIGMEVVGDVVIVLYDKWQ